MVLWARHVRGQPRTRRLLCAAGFTAPPWAALVDAAQASDVSHFGDVARGWQQAACSCLDQRALETPLSDLDSASRALLLSQAGSGSSVVLTTLPTREEFTMPDDVARCVLLRRLRLPRPLSSSKAKGGNRGAAGINGLFALAQHPALFSLISMTSISFHGPVVRVQFLTYCRRICRRTGCFFWQSTTKNINQQQTLWLLRLWLFASSALRVSLWQVCILSIASSSSPPFD